MGVLTETEYNELSAKEKITRAKIQLGYEKPFWAYLLNNIKIKADKDYGVLGNMKTICACSSGDVYYDDDFINSLPELELRGVLAHEVFHIAFEHVKRFKSVKDADAELFNICADMVVNNELLKDGFKLADGGVIPRNDKFEGLGLEVENISDKSVEMIYSELAKHVKKCGGLGKRNGFDEHVNNKPNNKDGDGNGDDDKGQKIKGSGNIGNTESQKDWKQTLSDAYAYAKQKGNVSGNLKRMIGEILNPQISWKQKLYKYITKEIPTDYTYIRPSKKSIASGVYLPSTLKENLEIVAGIDVSGSISQKDYDEFIGELIGIARGFQNVKIKLLTWDVKIQSEYEFKNGDIENIKNVDLKGGWGGTDVNCVFKKINDDLPSTKVAVILTDGYFGRISEEIKTPTLWVLTQHGTDAVIENKGEVVRIK